MKKKKEKEKIDTSRTETKYARKAKDTYNKLKLRTKINEIYRIRLSP